MERIGGWLLGAITLCALGIIGVVRFIPDAGRYLRIKNM
jgi:hypothetical protein